ncbi:hypothetical protein ACGFJT_37435 [Actinomadura geliboluensis]|uniref:hypothetical protein n=1 Tax=Actinomadura geliboluensis TaxID=882440 RepID=UPI0037139BD2
MAATPLPYKHQTALILAVRASDHILPADTDPAVTTSLIRRRLAYRHPEGVYLVRRGVLAAGRCADPNPASPLPRGAIVIYDGTVADEVGVEYEVLAVDSEGRLTIRDTYNQSTTLRQVRRGSIRDTGRRVERSPFEED